MPSILVGDNGSNGSNPINFLDYLLRVSDLGSTAYILVYRFTEKPNEIVAFAASSKKSLDNRIGCDTEDHVQLLKKGIQPMKLYKDVVIGGSKDYREGTVF